MTDQSGQIPNGKPVRIPIGQEDPYQLQPATEFPQVNNTNSKTIEQKNHVPLELAINPYIEEKSAITQAEFEIAASPFRSPPKLVKLNTKLDPNGET